MMMMAIRLRVLHIIIVGVIAITILCYSSYCSSPLMSYHIETKHDNTTLPANTTKGGGTVVEKAPLTNVPQVSSSIQKIPLKKTTENQTTVDKTVQGILTEALYESGHDIPSTELCPELGANLRVFVGIMSAPSHEDARKGIRFTWGHFAMQRDVAIGFIVGHSKEVKTNEVIVKESAKYGDIIRGNFIDSYDNLTLKTVSFLDWVDSYCTKAKFILKTDDDMFINFPKLLTFIDKHSNVGKTIFGRLAKKWKPIRITRSKYYVSMKQFKATVFPDFTTGPAYLMTGDIIHDMYKNALNHTYLKLEDVFTTGIVAQSINVKRVHINEFFNKRIESFNACSIKKYISIHMIKYHEQLDLWRKLLDERFKCR